MPRCTFEYAEGERGRDEPAAGAGADTSYSTYGGRDDLPQPAVAGRDDLRGVLAPDNVFDLTGEAAGGQGAAVFAQSDATRFPWLALLLGGAALYYFARRA